MRLLLPALLAVAGCATVPRGLHACPGSSPVCLTGQDCDVDKVRNCTVCVCRAWDVTNPPGSPAATRAHPEGVEPVPPRPREP